MEPKKGKKGHKKGRNVARSLKKPGIYIKAVAFEADKKKNRIGGTFYGLVIAAITQKWMDIK